MSHTTLEKHYKTVFMMVQHYNYSISDIENVYPFERDIFYTLLKKSLEERANGE